MEILAGKRENIRLIWDFELLEFELSGVYCNIISTFSRSYHSCFSSLHMESNKMFSSCSNYNYTDNSRYKAFRLYGKESSGP